ncbi:MAG: hypothetical protein JWS12_807 [Candidatus Saccharibacteria bacterium]|nr:hypothetical protein [Candidatus Saccharibacteria bacterium]
MLGYPGAGKTTTAKIIHELTGAELLWADHARREMFTTPTHSPSENLELYNHLNDKAASLLARGRSVIFDTNFNFYKDREHLRQIANRRGAKTLLVWVTAPKELAKQRATDSTPLQHTRILGNMPATVWERLSSNLQPPRPDELTLQVDGTKVSPDYIRSLLSDTL